MKIDQLLYENMTRIDDKYQRNAEKVVAKHGKKVDIGEGETNWIVDYNGKRFEGYSPHLVAINLASYMREVMSKRKDYDADRDVMGIDLR